MLTDPFFVKKDDQFGRALSEALEHRAADPSNAIVTMVRSAPLSMLGEETLRAMHLAARECDNVILEIGAYVGGGTIVLLDGAARAGALVVTLEEPVRHSHPQIPTSNSIEDLKRNIDRHAPVDCRHHLIAGCSFESWVLGELQHTLLGHQIGFLAWDADACFERDLALLAPFLSDHCLLMVDDYSVGEGKSGRITKIIDRLVADGLVDPIAYLPWGTLFLRLIRRPAGQEIQAWLVEWDDLQRAGDPYADRLLSYRNSPDENGQRGAYSFEDRQEFWRRASQWSS